MKEYKFSVEQKGNVTIFENTTDMYIEVSLKPVKPKRKHMGILIITPGKFVIYDRPLDLSKLSFSFTTREEELNERQRY